MDEALRRELDGLQAARVATNAQLIALRIATDLLLDRVATSMSDASFAELIEDLRDAVGVPLGDPDDPQVVEAQLANELLQAMADRLPEHRLIEQQARRDRGEPMLEWMWDQAQKAPPILDD